MPQSVYNVTAKLLYEVGSISTGTPTISHTNVLFLKGPNKCNQVLTSIKILLCIAYVSCKSLSFLEYFLKALKRHNMTLKLEEESLR